MFFFLSFLSFLFLFPPLVWEGVPLPVVRLVVGVVVSVWFLWRYIFSFFFDRVWHFVELTPCSFHVGPVASSR